MITMLFVTQVNATELSDFESKDEQQFRKEVKELIDNNIRAGAPVNVAGMESFNQNDYNSNFTEYADIDATIILQMPINDTSGISNVVGTVFDKETNEVIPNAVLTVKTENGDEILSVATDDSGRFQILGLPGGFYDWTLGSEDYCNAKYIGYDVCDGITTMFSFYMSKEENLERTSFQSQEVLYDSNHGNLTPNYDLGLNEEDNSGYTTLSFSKIPNLSSFTVGIGADSRGNGGTATKVDRFSYLAHVVASEALGSWVCKYTHDMTDLQIKHYYAAQAVASCSFIEWNAKRDPKHSQYTVCDTSNCQRYDPTKTDTYAVEALSFIYDVLPSGGTSAYDSYYTIMLYKPTNNTYEYMYPAYFAQCTGKTKTHPSRPELQSVSCSDIDGTHSEYSGNGWGMCQRGAAKLAKDGYSYHEILQHYYTDIAVVTAFE